MRLPAGWQSSCGLPGSGDPIWVATSRHGRVRVLLYYQRGWELRIIEGDRVEILRTVKLARVRERLSHLR